MGQSSGRWGRRRRRRRTPCYLVALPSSQKDGTGREWRLSNTSCTTLTLERFFPGLLSLGSISSSSTLSTTAAFLLSGQSAFSSSSLSFQQKTWDQGFNRTMEGLEPTLELVLDPDQRTRESTPRCST